MFEVTATDGAARAGVLHDRARRGADAGVHAGRDEGDREDAPPRRGARRSARRSCSATPTTCTSGPGDELIAELGGLHRFMAWDGPILTDSGGFQVFSLRDTLLAVDDDGVTFRSVYDGAATRFTPELAAAIQRNLGSDIAMCLDHVPPAGVAARRARRCRAAHDRVGAPPAPRARAPTGQLRFAINQGGTDPELRRRSRRGAARARLRRQRDRRPRDRRGPRRRCSRRPTGSTALLPAEKPRYFMGIGDAEGILEVIEAGRRHVRLRPADPHRPHRQRDHVGGPAQPPQRPLRPRPAPLDDELRLPGLHDVHAGLHPPPREPGRAARPPPALAPQSTLPARADPPRARGDRAARRSAPSNATHWSASRCRP